MDMFRQKYAFIVAAIFMAVFVSAHTVSAAKTSITYERQTKKDLYTAVRGGLQVAANVLGIISLVVLFTGGFKWMTATGNSGALSNAKQTVFYGLIGITAAILLALLSYPLASLTAYIFS